MTKTQLLQIIAKETETEKVRAINEGKPETAAEQIAKGRVNKNFFQRVSLPMEPAISTAA